jgi:phage FluMu protein Com
MKKQFDEFFEVKCPKCGEVISQEVLINVFNKLKEKD